MRKKIDCLLIGHNESDLGEYEKQVRKMGVNSGAYRSLNIDLIRYNNTPYSASDVFNLLHPADASLKGYMKPLSLGENFNAAIAYLGTYLHRRGFTFDYVNSFQEEKSVLIEKLVREDIQTIAVLTTLYITALPIVEIIDFVREHNQTASIVVGGPFISNQYRLQAPADFEFLLKSIGADFYINSSQGEATLVNLIDHLNKDLDLARINNLYFNAKGELVSTPIKKENNILSENMVNWDLFAPRAGEYANVRYAISCPFKCAYCGFPQHAGKFQAAGVEDVERELDLLAGIETMKSINIIDDTFNVPMNRFKKILRLMVKNKYKFKWHSHLRCQFLDREAVQLMKESRCEGVFLGIESGNNQILENMNKRTNIEEYIAGIELLKEYRILTFGSFIVGFPGETSRTVEDTVNFISRSGIDFYRIQLWYCNPATPIWNEREKYKLEGSQFQWSHATMDSKIAADLMEESFLSIEEPVWLPQYNFEFDGIFHMLHRGYTLEQVKGFIRAFNKGIKEKLTAPSQKDVSFQVLKELEEFYLEDNNPDTGIAAGSNRNILDGYNAEFGF